MPEFELTTRESLPSELAFLRASYGRDCWRSNTNFGELSNFWLHVHDNLRQQGAALGLAMSAFQEGRSDHHEFRRTFPPALTRFLQHLDGHHQIEDRHYFPKFRSLDQRMKAGFDVLDRDHQQIHGALLNSAEAANRFLAAFESNKDVLANAADDYAAGAARLVSMLMRHLADEEDLVIPAMLHYGEQSVG